MTGQQGDSPVDDIIQEDASAVNDGQDDEQGPMVKWRQNRKRKKKNQSLREMVFERRMDTHTYTNTCIHIDTKTYMHAYAHTPQTLKSRNCLFSCPKQKYQPRNT